MSALNMAPLSIVLTVGHMSFGRQGRKIPKGVGHPEFMPCLHDIGFLAAMAQRRDMGSTSFPEISYRPVCMGPDLFKWILSMRCSFVCGLYRVCTDSELGVHTREPQELL